MVDPYFEAGYHIDRYYELEEDFLKVLKYMPLEIYDDSGKRCGAKSTYLADLLLRIGSNIDVMFRKLILSDHPHIYDDKLREINNKLSEEERPQKKKVNLSFEDYRKLDEEILPKSNGGKLSDCKVMIIQTREDITPFENWSTDTPTWWSSYNHIKHEAMFDEANLDNVINALAALFLLICIKKHSIKMLNYGYLCINPSYKSRIIHEKLREIKHDIVTKLFISPIKS